MITTRPDRVAAAVLLTALVASLSLLAHPSGKASATSSSSAVDVSASVRYGCPADNPDPVNDGSSMVDVTLTPGPHASNPLVVQVGLGNATSTSDNDMVSDGGPSLVELGSGSSTVRLAGTAQQGDYVYIRQLDKPDVITVPVPACRPRAMPDYGLTDPDVMVSRPGCAGSQASLKVTLTNPNSVDEPLQKLGLDELGYTVLLVRSDGKLSGVDPAGQLVLFDQPGKQSVSITQAASKPASYQVRVIAPDGAVSTVGDKRLSCDSVGHPGPTPSVSPTPVPPSSSTPVSSSTPSTVPTSSHSTSAPATSTHRSTSAASSHPARSGGPASPTANRAQPQHSQAVLGAADTTSKAVAAKPSPTRSSPAPVVSNPKPSQVVAEVRWVPSVFGRGGLFSGSALLIVLVFAASMVGLVGSTVRSARRR